MPAKEAVFIFTKERPETLLKTLTSIKAVFHTKYVIDDSITATNQAITLEVCNNFLDCVYLGKDEFDRFISSQNINITTYSFLLRQVGYHGWNLGYARNFALLYAKAIGIERVLFSDDDIEVTDKDLIQELFQSIDRYQFAGANILGLVDDSVLGHIATDLNVLNERMLSGGFMVFSPKTIDHFFLNNYNEDWIWLFLQLKDKKFLQEGNVYQELTDPLVNFEAKVISQEFGEIALDGILNLYKEGSYDSLLELGFWENMIRERGEYLDKLLTIADEKGKNKYIEIIKCVQSNSVRFNAKLFSELYNDYYNNRILFLDLYQSL